MTTTYRQEARAARAKAQHQLRALRQARQAQRALRARSGQAAGGNASPAPVVPDAAGALETHTEAAALGAVALPPEPSESPGQEPDTPVSAPETSVRARDEATWIPRLLAGPAEEGAAPTLKVSSSAVRLARAETDGADAAEAPPQPVEVDPLHAGAVDRDECTETCFETASAPSMSEECSQSDLDRLPGIGPGLVAVLKMAGVNSLADLAIADTERLRVALGLVGDLLELGRWVHAASRLAVDETWTDAIPAEPSAGNVQLD